MQGKRGMLCEITGSFARGSDKGWLAGDHEGEKVVVLNVFDAVKDKYVSRARIKLHETTSPEPVPEIPVQLLRPVLPERIGEDVLILAGDHKGYEGKVRDTNSQYSVVSITGTQLMVEVKSNKLVKMVHLDD